MTDAYAAAKLLNAAVMSAAVFPAYWIARRVVRPSYALLTAAAAVDDAGDGLPRLPHVGGARVPGLPLCSARAPARGREAAVSRCRVVCALAVATRVQFLVLPLAYLAAVARLRARQLPAPPRSRHAHGRCSSRSLVGIPGALGQYGEATHIGHAPGAVAHWALTTGSLLPFSLGLAIVPGALFGLALLSAARRSASITIAVHGAVPRPGGADRRRRGAPPARALRLLRHAARLRRVLRVRGARRAVEAARTSCTTCIGAVALSLVSFPGLTGTAGFFFDSFTLTGFARVSYYTRPAERVAALRARAARARRARAERVARSRMSSPASRSAIALATGAGGRTRPTGSRRASPRGRSMRQPPDWLDRSGLGPATYLVLPRLGLLRRHEPRELEPRGPPRRRPADAAAGSLPEHGRARRPRRDACTSAQRRPHRRRQRRRLAPSASTDSVVARPRQGLVAYRIARRHPHVQLARRRARSRPLDRYQARATRHGRFGRAVTTLTLAVPRGTSRARVSDRQARR